MKTPSISALPGKISATGVLLVCAVMFMNEAIAVGPPNFPKPFIMAPILNTFKAIETQRHQSRTQLYREALEELRKNPKAADVPECPAGGAPAGVLCLASAKTMPVEETPAKQKSIPMVSDAKTPVAES